jgi:hypothetical protein
MIDDKPIKTEITLIKQIIGRLGDISGSVSDFFRRISLKEKSRLYLISDEEFTDQGIKIISNFTIYERKSLILTFDDNTRDISDGLSKKGIDVMQNIFFIDAISYSQGNGSPPVPNLTSLNTPNDYENMFYYSQIQLKNLEAESKFIIVISPGELLKFSDYNEIGTFFQPYVREMEKNSVPVIFLMKKSSDKILRDIIVRLVGKTEELD